MSAGDSTDLSPLVRDAAAGRLPAWTVAGEKRRAHMGRVAALMCEWAEGLDLGAEERDRWCAAGWLHDILREETPDALRPQVPEEFRTLPGKLLHGPAAAERLAGDVDEEIADAIRYHTLGSPRFGRLGRALYLADFLEPGRKRLDTSWTERLRARMPHEMDTVLREVVAARVEHVIEGSGSVYPETAAFHAQVVTEAR